MWHGIEREVEVDKQKRECLRLEDAVKAHVTGCSLRGKIVLSLTIFEGGGRDLCISSASDVRDVQMQVLASLKVVLRLCGNQQTGEQVQVTDSSLVVILKNQNEITVVFRRGNMTDALNILLSLGANAHHDRSPLKQLTTTNAVPRR